MKIRLATIYDCPSDVFVEYLQSTESFRYVTWPILTFEPMHGAWPQRWQVGYAVFRFRFLGILPMGSQEINITNPSQGVAADGSVVLRDNGQGTLMERWDHWITAKPYAVNQTHYVDEVEVCARHLAPVLTPVYGLFALIFYAHRQRRWRKFLLEKKRSP